MNDSLVKYIFLSREIPLPLDALKILKIRFDFNEIIDFSERRFRDLLLGLKKNDNVLIRSIDKKVDIFIKKKSNSAIFEKIERDLKEYEQNQINCISYFDETFPPLLKNISNPPKIVFLKGEILPEDEKAVAIIGTRNPTPYGRKMATEIARKLSKHGFTIVSGLAKGIDTIAMESALDAGGRAIGVIPSGILNLYPKENRYMIEKLKNNGVIISERFPHDSVTKQALIIRNRITSGFGLGNIFVEGSKYSGTRHQYNFGEKQEKISFGVEPIDYDCEQAFIPNWIINEKHGAKISSIEDIDFVAEILTEKLEEKISKRKEIVKKKNTKFQQITDYF